MLLQLALAEETLAETHLIHITLDVCDEILHAFCASGTVFLDSLTELVAAQFHVVEIRDGFAEAVGDVGELSLELSEGLSCVIRAFWVYCLLGDGIRNEDGNTPVLLVFVFYIGLAVARLDEGENLAVDIVSALFFELLADVGSYFLDIVLQEIYIGEDRVVDALENIVWCIIFYCCHLVGVIDESITERFYLIYSSGDVEL